MVKKKATMRPIDSPLYRYRDAFYKAFFSRSLYVDVAKRWQGYGILYFLCVILIAAIPLSVRILIDFNRYFNVQMIQPIKKYPKIYIQNGQVSINEKTPYFIKNTKGAVVTIIDPSGTIKFDNKYPELATLFSKDKIYFRPPKFQLFLTGTSQTMSESIFVQPISKKTNEIFSGEDWLKQSGILKLQLITDIFIYPMIVFFMFSLYIVFMLFLAVLGQVFSQTILKVKLTYKESCRLLFVSSTPQLLVFFLFLSVDLIPAGIGYIYVVILGVYFYYAVFSVKRDSNKLVRG